MTSTSRLALPFCLALAGCGASVTPTDTGSPGTDAGTTDTGATADDAGHDASASDDAGSDAPLVLGDAGCASAPTFDDVSTAILTVSCGGPINCHGGSSFIHGGSLVLDDANAYDALVGFPSSADTSILRVEPGNPATSLLYRKLINDLPADGSLGSPMPNGEGIAWHELPADEIELVRCWIATGATR